MYKPLTANNFNVDWLKTVSYAEFKKNSIIAKYEPHEQDSMFHKFTGRRHKARKNEGEK